LRRGEQGRRWEMFTPGAIFAVAFWLLISLGLRFYVSQFSAFNATYGALGGVMALMLWLYLTGLAILVGGEINSVMRTSPSSH
ncbi:MAG: YihY/virulence factor BrkB family protein, partial [Blastocatellia bacterium]